MGHGGRGAAHPDRPSGTGYVLFVGTPEPRKNLARLAEAAAAAGLRLVVAGAGGWGDGRPAAVVEWLGRVDGRTLGGGSGRTKKHAEQEAARVVVEQLERGAAT